MSQTLLGYYCFNDNSATSVKDFSVNGRTGTGSNLTISTDTGAIGKVGVFNGTSSKIDLGSHTCLNGLTAFSIVCKFYLNEVGISHILSCKGANHLFEVTTSNYLQIALYSGSSATTLTDTNVLAISTWYTAIVTYDGTTISLYLDDYDTVETQAMTGTLDTSASNTFIGFNDATKYLRGKMEMLSYYSKAFIDKEIVTIFECPSGIKYEATDAKLKTGDLVKNNAGGNEIVIWYEEFDERSFSDGEDHEFNDEELIIYPN